MTDALLSKTRYVRITLDPTKIASPRGGAPASFFLENPHEGSFTIPAHGSRPAVTCKTISGTEVDKDGNRVDRIHVLGADTIKSMTEWRMSLTYGWLMKLDTKGEPIIR